MQSKKKWLIAGGGLAVVAVVGLAVGLNQGELFRGSLSSLSPAAAPADYTAEYLSSGQNANHSLIKVKAVDGTEYSLFVDKKAYDNQAIFADESYRDSTLSGLVFDVETLAYMGYDENMYLKVVPTPVAAAPAPAAALVPAPVATVEQPTIAPAPIAEQTTEPSQYLDRGTAPVLKTEIQYMEVAPTSRYDMVTSTEYIQVDQADATYTAQPAVTEASYEYTIVNDYAASAPVYSAPAVLEKYTPITEKVMYLAPSAALPVAHAQEAVPVTPVITAQLDAKSIFRMSKLGEYDNGDYIVNVNKAGLKHFSFRLRLRNSTKGCVSVDRLAFTPAALIYDQSTPVTPQTTDLSIFKGETEVGIPDGKMMCPRDLSKLKLEPRTQGLFLGISDSEKLISRDLLYFEGGVKGKTFSVVDDSIIVNAVDKSGLNVLRFSNDFNKLKAIGLQPGVKYKVEVKGMVTKDPSKPAGVDNLRMSPEVAASYSLELKAALKPVAEKPAPTPTPVAQPTPVPVPAPTPAPAAKPTNPCMVVGKAFNEIDANSQSCKDLQSLAKKDTTTGETTQTIIKSDVPLSTDEYRLTTALVTQRVLTEAGIRNKTRNLSTDWQNGYVDANSLKGMTTEEQNNVRLVVANGYLRGFIDSTDGDKTLVPLQTVSKLELLTIMRQAVENVQGKTFTVDVNKLSPNIRDLYASDKGTEWIAVTYSWANSAGLITSDEDTLDELLVRATRSNSLSVLAKFQDWVDANKSSLM